MDLLLNTSIKIVPTKPKKYTIFNNNNINEQHPCGNDSLFYFFTMVIKATNTPMVPIIEFIEVINNKTSNLSLGRAGNICFTLHRWAVLYVSFIKKCQDQSDFFNSVNQCFLLYLYSSTWAPSYLMQSLLAWSFGISVAIGMNSFNYNPCFSNVFGVTLLTITLEFHPELCI